MTQEIERKFLINKPLPEILADYNVVSTLQIEQRYLDATGKWTIRLRQCVEGNYCSRYLTFKKKISDISCTEIETNITKQLYSDLSAQCGLVLTKTRYIIRHEGHVWEIDHFRNEQLDNLVIAEIELDHEEEDFLKPDWLGEEVTHDKQYKNAKLVKRLGE